MASVFKRKGRPYWMIAWEDADGRRHELSSRTTDKRLAERLAAAREGRALLRKEGLIDAAQERAADEGRRPLAELVDEYLAHCEDRQLSARSIHQKRFHLQAVAGESGAATLVELTEEAALRSLRTLRDAGRSARTWNFRRQILVTFGNWAERTGRLMRNPWKSIPTLDEGLDRRRERRALSLEEVQRLLAAAHERGRRPWYMAALLAGLRKGELGRLTWTDVDFERGAIRIRNRKGGRLDEIGLHPDLAAELLRIRPTDALPSARVFPTTVTDRTRQGDFRRAGIAPQDEDGRWADLHSMRATLATYLERAGASLLQAQRVLRHQSAMTTQKHYQKPELLDTSRALDLLPRVGPAVQDGSDVAAATGTEGDLGADHRQHQRQYGRGQTCQDLAQPGKAREPDASDVDRPKSALRQDLAGLGTDCPELTVERVTGLEPATFSLGS